MGTGTWWWVEWERTQRTCRWGNNYENTTYCMAFCETPGNTHVLSRMNRCSKQLQRSHFIGWLGAKCNHHINARLCQLINHRALPRCCERRCWRFYCCCLEIAIVYITWRSSCIAQTKQAVIWRVCWLMPNVFLYSAHLPSAPAPL